MLPVFVSSLHGFHAVSLAMVVSCLYVQRAEASDSSNMGTNADPDSHNSPASPMTQLPSVPEYRALPTGKPSTAGRCRLQTGGGHHVIIRSTACLKPHPS